MFHLFYQDGRVEQKWKWPLGRLQTTVSVQVHTSTQLIKLCLNGFFVPFSGSSFWFVFYSWITLSVCAVWASQGSPCTSAARVRQLSSMLEWHKEQNLLNLLNWFVCKTLVFFFLLLNWFSLFCPFWYHINSYKYSIYFRDIFRQVWSFLQMLLFWYIKNIFSITVAFVLCKLLIVTKSADTKCNELRF